MVVQIQILYISEKIGKPVSYHASQVIFLVGLSFTYLRA